MARSTTEVAAGQALLREIEQMDTNELFLCIDTLKRENEKLRTQAKAESDVSYDKSQEIVKLQQENGELRDANANLVAARDCYLSDAKKAEAEVEDLKRKEGGEDG